MLKENILTRIRKNKELKNDLCSVLNISYPTLYRWLDKNSPSLTRYEALRVIAAHLREEIDYLTDRTI